MVYYVFIGAKEYIKLLYVLSGDWQPDWQLFSGILDKGGSLLNTCILQFFN